MHLTAIPTFRITDYEKVKSFYVDFLGCTIDWESHPAPGLLYMQVSKHGLVLHLAENERFRTGSVVFVETTGMAELHAELSAKNNSIPAVAQTPWGTNQLELEDPFGNLLRFNETI